MNYGLKENIVEQVKGVLALFPEIEEAIIYGSRAKGNFKPGSDVDITLKGNKINLSVLNKISITLDDLLLPYTFDLTIYRQIRNSDLIDHINHVGVVFYKKQVIRLEA